MTNRAKPLMRPRGFTLIELMVVVAIAAIIAAMAVPAFNDMIAKNKVKAAAEDIYGLVLQAKSEAPIRDQSISFNADVDADPWCVGISQTETEAACDCTSDDLSDDASCYLEVAETPVLQVVRGDAHPDVTVAESFSESTNIAFRPIRNEVWDANNVLMTPTSPATDEGISITSNDGDWQLDVRISPQGRLKVCNPNDNAISGYEEC